MRGAGSEAGDFAVVVARQQVIIAIAIGQPEIDGGGGRADVEPAHMHQMPGRRIGGNRAIEFRIARLGEQIADAHAGKLPRLLRHQRIERAQGFAAARRIDQLDLAELGELFALGAVAPARRRRALGRIKRFPVAGKMRQIGPARRHRAAQMPHRILLRADRFRHFLKMIKSKRRRGLLCRRLAMSAHTAMKRARSIRSEKPAASSGAL